jgi:UDP-glucose 4-epimerase
LQILVTGGAGYIGSHFVRLLLNKNPFGRELKIIVIDNLSRGHIEAIPHSVVFENVDLLDAEKLNRVVQKHSIDAVVHFAAFAYVGESVENPALYYKNNVVGTFNLLNSIAENKIDKFVFSSTCSIYGNPAQIPIDEKQPSNPINPYAKTKLIIEQMLEDFEYSYGLKYVALRYFNAAGASPDGEIGESHNPEPHLIPIVLQTALKKREAVSIFGNDYPTPDGTCIRDYIHIIDLGDAHIKALELLFEKNSSQIINLGTGIGNSVEEIINLSKEITGKDIKTIISERRQGDPAILVADNKKAKEVLNWTPQYTIKEIIEHAWNWHKIQKF